MKTRAFLLAGVAALSVLSASAAHAITCATIETSGDGPQLNVRLEPDQKSKSLEKVQSRDRLLLIDEDSTSNEDWAPIGGVLDEEGFFVSRVEGWVSKKYIRITPCPPPKIRFR
jgi:hypothetical protein